VSRRLAGLGAIAFCALLAEGGANDWAAVHLRTVHRAGPALASAAFAAFALALAAGRLAGDRLVAHAGRARVVRSGGLVAAAGGALVVISPLTGGALVGWAVLGAGLAPIVPAVLGAAAADVRIPTAAGIATVSATGYLGAFAGPPVIGLLAGGAGLGAALAVLGLAGLAGASLAGLADERGCAKTGRKEDPFEPGGATHP
jgi:MFS family permease